MAGTFKQQLFVVSKAMLDQTLLMHQQALAKVSNLQSSC